MSSLPLSIRAFEEPGRHVLVLTGELDIAGVQRFEEAAEQLCAMRPAELIVDITDVGFIDSVGVRAVLAVKGRCAQRGIEFSMTHASEQAGHVFELTKLLDHLPFRARREERFRREIELWPGTAEPAEEEAER